MEDRDYWAKLCRNLRQALNLTQIQMAERLGTDQTSVSRWERGLTEPQFEMRQLIEGLAQGQGLATLDHIVSAVRLSPFPMILVDRQSRVIAASSCSGFTAGVSVFDETPADERENLEHFNARLESSGFWDHRCDHLHYEAEINGKRQLAAVVTAIVIRGAVYALVQKAW
jgi:transcriptional regulator with XRE-family HTH domain